MFEFGAIDLGYSGSKFTWAKGNWGNVAIKRRLDRGIANISWILAYSKAAISHLGAINQTTLPFSWILLLFLLLYNRLTFPVPPSLPVLNQDAERNQRQRLRERERKIMSNSVRR